MSKNCRLGVVSAACAAMFSLALHGNLGAHRLRSAALPYFWKSYRIRRTPSNQRRLGSPHRVRAIVRFRDLESHLDDRDRRSAGAPLCSCKPPRAGEPVPTLGRADETKSVLRPIYVRFTKSFDSQDLVRARAVLDSGR